MSNLNQPVMQNLDYLPFGEILSSNSWHTTHMFTGDERDSETNLDHTWFRQYSSRLGRWMTPDPAGLAAVNPANPQSWNRYAYVLNNPLRAVDPQGLDCVYLNDEGDDIEFVDSNSNASDCRGSGGYWVDGVADANSLVIDPNSNWISIDNPSGLTQFTCNGVGDCGQSSLSSFLGSQDPSIALIYYPGQNTGTIYSTLSFDKTVSELMDFGFTRFSQDNINFFHPHALDLREAMPYCSMHLAVSKTNAGTNAGRFHVDLINPYIQATTGPFDAPVGHTIADILTGASTSQYVCH